MDAKVEWELLAMKATSWLCGKRGKETNDNNSCYRVIFSLVHLFVRTRFDLLVVLLFLSCVDTWVCGSWKSTVGLWRAERGAGTLRFMLSILTQDYRETFFNSLLHFSLIVSLFYISSSSKWNSKIKSAPCNYLLLNQIKNKQIRNKCYIFSLLLLYVMYA